MCSAIRPGVWGYVLTLLGNVIKCTAIGRPLSSVSPTFPQCSCSLVHVRLVFGLLQAVEELQAHLLCRFDRFSAGALYAQKALSAQYSPSHTGAVSSMPGCIAARSGVRAGRWCEVLPVGRPRREHRAHVQVHIPQRAEHSSHLSTHRLRCSQHHCASSGRARTGAFCRFAGRPSPGLSAVPPALRFEALSIFALLSSRRLSKLISGFSKNSGVVVLVHCVAGAGLLNRVAVVANWCCDSQLWS